MNIQRFLELLVPSKLFDQCEVNSSWGLLVFTFHRPSGTARVPMSVQLLQVLDGEVVNDDGNYVQRWHRVAEELLKWADEKATLGHAPVSTQAKTSD